MRATPFTTDLGELSDILPVGIGTDPDGALTLGGCRLTELADRFGTPTYLVDEGGLRAQAGRFRRALVAAWPASRVMFASKAFPSTAIYRLMAEEGVGADVAGPGELAMALAGGMEPGQIVLHGNAKTDAELAAAIEAGVGTIVIDNLDDIERLERLVQDEQAVLVRVIPGVRPDTHEAIATGQAGSKFGLPLPQATEAIARLRHSDRLRLEGLHLHIGSQILATEPWDRAVEAVAGLGEFDVYDLGGGLGVKYTYGDQPPSPEAWVEALAGAARRHLPSGAQIWIEPGRSLVARAGITIYRVVTVKRGEPTFVAVDGGMADNLEVALYGQRFEARMADRPAGGEPVELVGRHCESGDRLISGIRLAAPAPGDVIAVAATGAYCFTMSNNYNGALRPPVVFCRDGDATLQVRRETLADLFRRDVGPG